MPRGYFSQGWRRWKRVAEKVGRVQAFIIFSIIYFLLALPIGLVYKLLTDPLLIRRSAPSFWHPTLPEATSVEAARRQS